MARGACCPLRAPSPSTSGSISAYVEVDERWWASYRTSDGVVLWAGRGEGDDEAYAERLVRLRRLAAGRQVDRSHRHSSPELTLSSRPTSTTTEGPQRASLAFEGSRRAAGRFAGGLGVD